MNKLFIIISFLFFYVGFSQNNSFYGAFESSGVYYSQNESKDFEKTDLFIEKSIAASFELTSTTPLKSVIDFGKFIFKEKINMS